MEKKDFEILIKSYSNKINIKLKEKQIDNFYKYMQLLIEWNQKINLTAIIEPKEIILKHFIDSLTICKYIKENSSLIDVGTGAGFPGIPIKIIREDLKVTLLDSLNKRVNFLNIVINSFNLNNIETIHGRAEEIANKKEYREKFDVATSRAVANLSTLSEYLLPFVKENGIFIGMKGSEIEKEVKDAQKAISLLGGNIEKIEKFDLPESDIKRNLVIVKKIKLTPLKFPRKPGMPAKNPIQ